MFERETRQPGLLESLHLLGATILAFESIKMNNRLEGLPFRAPALEQAWQSSVQVEAQMDSAQGSWQPAS
jgi:hypothetical protein